MGCRREARRLVVGVGLLVPGLLLIPAPPPTDAAPAKPTAPDKPTARARPAAPAKPIATTKPVARRPAAKPKTGETAAAREAPDRCVHMVKSGDSVGRVAARYKVTRQAVLEANRLGSRDMLKIGQRLQVPGCVSAAAAAIRVEPVPTNTPFTASVGPRKVPTRLFLGTPDLDGRAIDFTWPVVGNVVSGVGRRRLGWHAGIDIKADVGTPVLAAASGTVYFAGWERAYGRVIKVEHDNGFASIYAHNLQNFVEAGDRVDLGQVIATVGRSGRSTAYHLHFEIRHEGTVLNPLFLLPRRDTAMVGPSEEMGEPLDEEEDE